MIRSISAAAVLTMLSACSGGGQGSANAAMANAAADNTLENGADAGRDYVAEVKALSPAARNGVFQKALRDANLGCQGVKDSQAAPDIAPNAWRVQCVEGRHHIVRVLNNGTVDITSGPAKS